MADLKNDERVRQSIELIQQAWRLADDLKALVKRFPEPKLDIRALSPEERVVNGYASCAYRVWHSLDFALQSMVMVLDWDVRKDLLPPSAGYLADPQTWLKEQGEKRGDGPPTP